MSVPDQRWRVVSRYRDGDQILEGEVDGARWLAEDLRDRVVAFRDDQDELPDVRIEPVVTDRI